MSQQLNAAMPPDLNIPGGYTIRFTAIDPGTGVVVNGVKVSAAAIQAAVVLGSVSTLDSGPFMFVPGPGA